MKGGLCEGQTARVCCQARRITRPTAIDMDTTRGGRDVEARDGGTKKKCQATRPDDSDSGVGGPNAVLKGSPCRQSIHPSVSCAWAAQRAALTSLEACCPPPPPHACLAS
ncbi:hypothetical protein VFPFJ_02480 [Purpureocillium lilacinum]|uniref:Uncharacterized protein n=1 Tax=Purpureocillium lilacinum TaxID=33203 RepID=A0A179HV39_PURLI|nr:hypothetical protein VFPFJ_02480 [Purpureocillium lilacinum]OAQ93319.1 hypothetical protein VFPFJ_02480 [Purpureocillium lilacinum]